MNADAEQHGSTAHPDAEQIGALRQEMLRFARLQLRDPHLAEDAVHEAIAGALKSSGYKGRAQLKTWVFAILRNKIVDVIRERSRHPSEPLIEEPELEPELEAQFKSNGHWAREQRPTAWRDPETSLANDQFWVIFEICLNEMPENPARVFMMREHLGLEVKDICTELNISESNCWVLMHRARMRLRMCLENNFMQQDLHSHNEL
jgi:RNA polymerase sigma-70 factor (ECF subfamily)